MVGSKNAPNNAQSKNAYHLHVLTYVHTARQPTQKPTQTKDLDMIILYSQIRKRQERGGGAWETENTITTSIIPMLECCFINQKSRHQCDSQEHPEAFGSSSCSAQGNDGWVHIREFNSAAMAGVRRLNTFKSPHSLLTIASEVGVTAGVNLHLTPSCAVAETQT